VAAPKVSIIIPLYGGAAFIRATLQSALGQTYPNIEVVVVNDGSPDNSEQVAEDLLRVKRVVYVKQRNQGVAAARNTGIRAATGELVAFLDQDDLWAPDKLELQVRHFAAHPEVGLLHGNVRFIDKAGDPIREREDRWDAHARLAVGCCFPVLFEQNRLAMLTVCMRRACFDAVGPFREDLAGVDDYEYWLRLSRRFAFAHLDRTLAFYRLHGANDSVVNWLPQELMTLQSIEDLLARSPEARAELRPGQESRRVFDLSRAIGHAYYRRNMHAEARPYLLKALRCRPFAGGAYAELAMGSLPPRVRAALRWYAQKLRGSRVPHAGSVAE